jgi:hypothetical protein
MGNEMETDSPEVARFLEQLRALPSAEEPVPSEELLALLNGTPTLAGARSRRTSVLAAAAVAAVVAGTGWAAAAGQLPGPVQDAFADFSEHYLPFELPHRGDGARVDLDVDDPAQPDRTHRDDPVARRDQDPAVAGTTGQPASAGAGTDAAGTTAGDGTPATGGTTPRGDDEGEPDGGEDRGHVSAPGDGAEGTHDGSDDSAQDEAQDGAGDDSTDAESDESTDESEESTGSGSDGGRDSGDGSDDASGSGGGD